MTRQDGQLLLRDAPRADRVALYYPYIHFRSRSWLRAAMLYYDQISRIVPSGVDIDLELYYREFLDDAGPLLEDISALKVNDFLIEDRPEPYVSSIAEEFFEFAQEHLIDEKKRSALVPKLALRGQYYTIHPAKIDPTLSEILVELKLAHKRKNDPWSDLDVEPVTGGLYMLFLARRMANYRNLISDSSVYQSLLHQKAPAPGGGADYIGDGEYRLATAVLKTVIPTNLELIPIDRLLRVRDDLGAQRRRFQDKISALASDLDHIDSEERLGSALEKHQRKLEDEYQELTDKLRSSNLSFATSLFAVSVPTWATAAWGMNIKVMTPVLAGIGAVALSGVLLKNVFDRQSLLRTNSMSYLLNLRKRATAKTMAKRIVSLDLSTPFEEEPAANTQSRRGGRWSGGGRGPGGRRRLMGRGMGRRIMR